MGCAGSNTLLQNQQLFYSTLVYVDVLTKIIDGDMQFMFL